MKTKVQFESATLRVTHTPRGRQTVLTFRDAGGNALRIVAGPKAVALSHNKAIRKVLTRTDTPHVL